MRAKGQDWTVRVMRDGAVVATFQAFNSVEINFGLGVEVSNYVGETTPRVRGVNNEVTFSCPFDVDSPAYVELLDAQRLKNLPNGDPNRAALRIDISCSVDFGTEGRTRVKFNDCTLHDANLSASGRVEGFVNASPTFTAPTWKRL